MTHFAWWAFAWWAWNCDPNSPAFFFNWRNVPKVPFSRSAGGNAEGVVPCSSSAYMIIHATHAKKKGMFLHSSVVKSLLLMSHCCVLLDSLLSPSQKRKFKTVKGRTWSGSKADPVLSYPCLHHSGTHLKPQLMGPRTRYSGIAKDGSDWFQLVQILWRITFGWRFH